MFLLHTCKIKNKHESLLHISRRYFCFTYDATNTSVYGKMHSVENIWFWQNLWKTLVALSNLKVQLESVS